MVSRPGFTLVEVIVAITLLAVGVLALAASSGFAAAMLRGAQRGEAAARLAGALLDSLVHVPSPGAGEQRRGGLRAEWSTAAGVISLTVSYAEPGGPRAHRWEAHSLAAADRLPAPPEPADE